MHVMSRAVLVAASLLVAPALQAQTSFSAAIGATVPIGDAADGLETGYNAIVGLGIKPPLAPIGARIEGMFSAMAFKDVGSTSIEASSRILAGIANATFSPMALPSVYLIGGLGMYNMGCSGSACAGVESKTKLGINFGVGFNIPLTGFGTFIEARLHHVMTKDDATGAKNTQFVPITVGMKF